MSELEVAVIPVTPLEQNCTVLWDGGSGKGFVVDPGGDVPRIRAFVEENGITIERILLTHGHVDHAAGADELRAALGVEIVGPDERDRFLLDNLERDAAMFGLSGARNVTPDRWLEEGDEIAVGPCRLTVLHCPGHTPGHVVFVDKERRLALVGDVLFKGSIGRTDFPYGDHEALVASVREKLWPLGDDIAFICGHGPPSTFGEERASNPFVGMHA